MKQSRQLIEKRRTKIYNLIRDRKKVRVEELSAIFDVSDLTIRRDLEELEKKALIKRFFGGAEIVEEQVLEPVLKFDEKKTAHNDEKIMVAEYAASLVEDATSIFMNSGTTVLEVMKRVESKNIAIITNNALAGSVLENNNCELLCTGGVYNSITRSFVGEYATNLINQTSAEMAILGVNGINAVTGISTSIFQETVLFETMLEHCRGKKIIVTDGSKIGKTQNYKSADISQIDMLITTSSANPEELQKIRNAGVEVVIVDQEI